MSAYSAAETRTGRQLPSAAGLALFVALALLTAVLAHVAAVSPWTGFPDRHDARLTAAPFLHLADESRRLAGAAALPDLFAEHGFDLASVRDGDLPVPRLFLASLPQDMAALRDPETRKQAFLRLALPLVLVVNEHIATERGRLMSLKAAADGGTFLSYPDDRWLDDLGRRYGVLNGDLDELARRVDEIPPSLAVAQAATESGWGTSQLARLGNALFGQKVWTETGIEAFDRVTRTMDRYAAFDQLADCIGAYTRNLNTHWAYADFRVARAEMRARKERPDGYALAPTLSEYSTRGADYIDDLRRIIRVNKLRPLDKARLDTVEGAELVVPVW